MPVLETVTVYVQKMDVFYFSSLLSCICICAVQAHPQFYYMVPQPQPAQTSFYSMPFHGNSPFQYEPTAPFQFQPRQYDPPQLYYSTHQTFGNIPATDSQFPGYQTFAGNPFQSQYQQQPQSRTETPTNVIVSSGQTNGFVYHTQLNTGGSADVYFVMGPQADQLPQLQRFGDGIQNSTTNSPLTEKAKTLASDTVDSKASNKKPQQQITETLTGTMPPSPFDAIRSFLGKSQDGFQQLYTTSQFFGNAGRNFNQNVPANTILLSTPTSTQIFGNFPFISSRFNVNENAVKNTTSQITDDKSQSTTSKTTDDKGQSTTSKTTDDKGQSTTTSKTTDDKDAEVAETTNTEVKLPFNNTTSTVSTTTSDKSNDSSTQTTTVKDEPTSTLAPVISVTP